MSNEVSRCTGDFTHMQSNDCLLKYDLDYWKSAVVGGALPYILF